MKIAFFDTHRFEQPVFTAANEAFGYEIDFLNVTLNAKTAKLAAGFDVVCSFVNDKLDAETLRILQSGRVGLVALRSAGFNHVDLKAAQALGLKVCRVPAYSPNSVAEFTVGLALSLNRKIHKAYQRVREQNFSIEGFVGFDLNGKTAGIIGTGKIGKIVAQILAAFGCRVLAFDMTPDEEFARQSGVRYVSFETLCRESDIISLHVPLTESSFHLIGESAFALMKKHVLLINTCRGKVLDSKALIQALKQDRIGGAALDVYEEEENVFFNDLSERVLVDDVLARLITFPNVLVTSHQAFLTKEALESIARTTLESVREYKEKGAVGAEKSLTLEPHPTDPTRHRLVLTTHPTGTHKVYSDRAALESEEDEREA